MKPSSSFSFSRPPREPLSLSLFFPCHNEEGAVEAVTRQAVEVGRSVAADLEVLIVDDASTDRTQEIAQQLSAEIPEVRVVRNEVSHGYGGALKLGFGSASKRWVFYTDGDGQFDIGELRAAIPLLEQYDIVSCYRSNREDTFLRRINGICWTTLMNLVFGLRLRDIDGAFKIYPKDFLDSIEILSDGALVDAEMLTKAKHLGLRIGQRGVRHYPRPQGESSGGKLGTILKAFRELAQLHRHIRRGKLSISMPPAMPPAQGKEIS